MQGILEQLPSFKQNLEKQFVPYFSGEHTSAKLIEIHRNCLSKIHILHDLGSHMESNDTLHGSELVLHWVLGPKN